MNKRKVLKYWEDDKKLNVLYRKSLIGLTVVRIFYKRSLSGKVYMDAFTDDKNSDINFICYSNDTIEDCKKKCEDYAASRGFYLLPDGVDVFE